MICHLTIQVCGRWSPAFNNYFMTHINPDVDLFSLWLAKELDFPTTENSIFTSNGCEHINFMARSLQGFREVDLHHMFHLARDFARGKLAEIAASHLGTGDYVFGAKYHSRNKARDVEKGTNLLARLGPIPPYATLVERLKKGESVPLWRTSPEEENVDEPGPDVRFDQGEEDIEDVQPVQNDLDPELMRAFRSHSVSPDTTALQIALNEPFQMR